MVDPLWVADARLRRGGGSRVEDGLALARERRAGRVVVGEVWQFKDTIYVRGLLYDPSGSTHLIREHAIRIAPDLSDAQVRFEELADSLLIGGGPASGAPPAGGGGQLSLPAWHAFQDGYAALQRWDLKVAKARFQEALTLDPTYGMAQLWMAQVMAWAGEEPGSWKSYAAGALNSSDSLAPRDRQLGEGLLALAEGKFPEACEQFHALIARDSLDFAAWFGLGDCQGRDPQVLRDSASPSGWRFRTSYQGAVNAYRRALQIVPSVHLVFRGEAFGRLAELLYTESNYMRHGFALTPDTLRFGAFPSMTRDTLEFVPRPITEVVAAEPGTLPPTLSAAVSHNREVMRDIATTWVEAFPKMSDAHETLARVLETLGELTTGRSTKYAALGEVRRARALVDDRTAALRLANIETRFLLKSEQMDGARTLADSVLRANPNPTLDQARQLWGLAALTGHVDLAANLQRRAAPDFTFMTQDWQEVKLPLPLTDAALGLFAYASFGGPLDSIVALEQRVERLLPSYVLPGRRTAVRQALLDDPAVLTFPERGIRPVHRSHAGGNYKLEMQWQLARGDTAALRNHFKKMQAFRQGLRPGDISFDATYDEVRLMLAVGDTAQATQLLDLPLNALPTLGTDLLDQLPQIATLVRAMALRAELATLAGDTGTAKHWAQDVLLLWQNADAELQPTVKRMRTIVANAH
jgi:tetratricopeptide (TPR) repeat protein